VLASRLASQLLAGPGASSVGQVADRLLAVQGQDARGLRLAIRARSKRLSASDVDEQLTVQRSLVITWLNRGTLHLVASEDYWWLQQLMAPPLFTGNARRLRQEGVSEAAADRGVGVVERALARDGPLTRSSLAQQISAAGVRVQGQALIHLLMLACLRGIAVRGPMVGGEQAYVLVRDWLGRSPAPIERDAALAALVHRYLAGHGPASDHDLARWAGLPLRDIRRGIAAIAPSLSEPVAGLMDLTDRAVEMPLPPPRLLGAFDPILLGWCSREFVLGRHQGSVTMNGMFRPFALVAGRAAGTWGMPNRQVVLAPFAELGRQVAAALRADAEDVVRFLA